MITWWASLSVLSKILWGVTLTATLVFIIQSILTFIGADVDGATDFDVDPSDMGGDLDGGINLYTFRNFVNFILGFGWTAILLKDSVQSVDQAQNILVIKTGSGMAMAAAAALDHLEFPEVVGSIAGDDTIMAAVRTSEETVLLMEKIRRMLEES